MPRKWIVNKKVNTDKCMVFSKGRKKNLTSRCSKKRTKALSFLSILFAENTEDKGL